MRFKVDEEVIFNILNNHSLEAWQLLDYVFSTFHQTGGSCQTQGLFGIFLILGLNVSGLQLFELFIWGYSCHRGFLKKISIFWDLYGSTLIFSRFTSVKYDLSTPSWSMFFCPLGHFGSKLFHQFLQNCISIQFYKSMLLLSFEISLITFLSH